MRSDPPDFWCSFAEPAPSMAEVGKARSPRREQRERIAKGLAVVKAARKAGFQVKSATIEGIVLGFGEPTTASGAEVGNSFNEWDRDLGRLTPQIRQ